MNSNNNFCSKPNLHKHLTYANGCRERNFKIVLLYQYRLLHLEPKGETVVNVVIARGKIGEY